jgi:DNA-binding response OmpR family regulator
LLRYRDMPPATVLLAIDDALIRWALEKDLSARGVEVCGAETDAVTLARVRWSDHGLVFLDLDPARKDGLTLLESIHESSPETRVVILGCDVDPAVKRAAFDRGVWQVVEKPFDLRDVVGLVRSVFGAYTRRREHQRYLCRLPLRVSVLGDAPDSRVELETLSCNTVDVGPGGMRFLTGYPLKVGQRLKANVMRPGDPCAAHVPRDAEGEVVWLGTTGNGFTGGLRWLPASTPDRTS